MKNCPNCGIQLRIAVSITATKQRTTPKTPTPFSSEESIAELLNEKRLDLKILGHFFVFRGDVFLSRDEFSDTIKANVRAAKVLASSNFPLDFYQDLFAYTEKKLSEIKKTKDVFITNLTTVTKFLQQFRKEFPGYGQDAS